MDVSTYDAVRQQVIQDVKRLKLQIDAFEEKFQRERTSAGKMINRFDRKQRDHKSVKVENNDKHDDVVVIDSDSDDEIDSFGGSNELELSGWDNFKQVEQDSKFAQELSDLELASQLQQSQIPENQSNLARSVISTSRDSSLIDPNWEIVDPNPDIRSLFIEFDRRFFGGKLAACEVRWSTRMTLCAGTCTYNRRSGYCVVTLSEPLLKFRTRKELLETLVHELIHAELFVTARNDNHSAHGEAFLSRMRELNRLTGLNVSVYHRFHDEVNYYRTHVWRCDGPCQTRKPFFGFVRRATNRAPSRNDFWFAEHQQNCGGTFHKVSEPEGYKARGRRTQKPSELPSTSNSQQPASRATASTTGHKDQRSGNIMKYFVPK